MTKWKDFKKKLLSEPGVRKEYERLAPRYEIIKKLIELRIENEMTQAQLAKKLNTKQASISRFESGNVNPTVDFMLTISQALGKKLNITFT
ncbi:MAG: helix-turn-helix transcriptional regulator [Candidatus Shapirobacteria bacterium]